MSEEDKIRENRLRRMAERQGFVLRKRRRRDPNAIDYGRYDIAEPRRNVIATFYESQEFGLTLDEVESWLTEDKSTRPTSPLVEGRGYGA